MCLCPIRTNGSVALTIRAATADDLPYVMALQRANRESVGGLPSPAIEERIGRATLTLASLNGDPCGYLMWDYRDTRLRIPQACIQYDARRREYGKALWLNVLAQCPDISEAALRCAADIDANLFWREMGFDCVTVVRGGTRRGRMLNVWRQWFGEPQLFGIDQISVTPVAQRRVDTFDEQTGFMGDVPDGFVDLGELPKLAWSNRKRKPDRD